MPPPEPHPLLLPLRGQDSAVHAFLDAAKSGRMHHAWLLHGPRGVGKASFAQRASAWLLAPNGRHSEPVLELAPDAMEVGLLERRAHPDAFWLDRQSSGDGKRVPANIPVDQVRKTLASLTGTPAYGGWRTLVIDSVDDLNREGANALLKPLEEPPRQTALFLVAHSLSSVLPTIRSRCRHLAFSPLQTSDMHQVLTQDHASDGVENADLLIELSDGSPGTFHALRKNPDVVDALVRFSALASNSPRGTERLDFSAQVNRTKGEARELLLSLMDAWIARRLRAHDEPIGLGSPAGTLTKSGKAALAALWSAQLADVATRDTINLDIDGRILALFGGIDQVYSEHVM